MVFYLLRAPFEGGPINGTVLTCTTPTREPAPGRLYALKPRIEAVLLYRGFLLAESKADSQLDTMIQKIS